MPDIVVNARTLHAPTTGVQRYTQALLEHFAGRVEVVAPPRPLPGVLGHAWEQAVLPRLLRGRLLWSPGNTGPLSVAAQVVTIHDAATLDHPEWFSPSFARLYALLLPRLARGTRRVLTVSEYSRARLLAHAQVPSRRIEVVPLAAAGRFRPVPPEERARVRALFGLPERYLLTVGSLEPRKNLGRLFQAWQAWENRPPEVQLAVVGGEGRIFGGLGFERLPEGVKLLGRVGDAELPGVYGAAEGFVYPSLYEGFGLPPLEAMASGTPVITSRTTSLPEVVGDAALMVDPYRPDSMLDAMRRLVNDRELQEDYRERGLERAKRFSWNRTAEETWNVLSSARDQR